MARVLGELRKQEGSARLRLLSEEGCWELRCGDRVEIFLDDRWRCGRVEYSGLLGWYWSDGRITRRLFNGDPARMAREGGRRVG